MFPGRHITVSRAALLLKAPKWKLPKCASTVVEWIMSLVYSHNGLLNSNVKDTGESHKHNVEGKKSDKKKYYRVILYSSFYVKTKISKTKPCC